MAVSHGAPQDIDQDNLSHVSPNARQETPDSFLAISHLTKSYGQGEARVAVLKGISTSVNR